jgi:hypothetical protein
MTNIIQKLVLRCRAMEFVQDNADSVKYQRTIVNDRFGIRFQTKHNVSISTPDKEISATLTKYPTAESTVNWSFVCEKKCDNALCILHNNRPFTEQDSQFALKIYTKMLNDNVQQHGCPVH